MPRKPRQLLDGACYHLVARGNNRQFLFQEEETFRYFLGLLEKAKSRYPAKLYHYCLMSNHIHLLLQIEEGPQLPKLMQMLLQGYGRWFQARQRYSGHVWQGRYKSPRIDRDSYYLEAGRYIERNPLRAKLVAHLADYRWSSYPHYAYGLTNALLDEDPYYASLGHTHSERQAAYRDFVRLDHPYDPLLDQQLIEAAF